MPTSAEIPVTRATLPASATDERRWAGSWARIATAPAPTRTERATSSRPPIRRESAPTSSSVPAPATAPNTAAVAETIAWSRAVRRTSDGENESTNPSAATRRAESRRATSDRRSTLTTADATSG